MRHPTSKHVLALRPARLAWALVFALAACTRPTIAPPNEPHRLPIATTHRVRGPTASENSHEGDSLDEVPLLRHREDRAAFEEALDDFAAEVQRLATGSEDDEAEGVCRALRLFAFAIESVPLGGPADAMEAATAVRRKEGALCPRDGEHAAPQAEAEALALIASAIDELASGPYGDRADVGRRASALERAMLGFALSKNVEAQKRAATDVLLRALEVLRAIERGGGPR
jgi:hypothetical protein